MTEPRRRAAAPGPAEAAKIILNARSGPHGDVVNGVRVPAEVAAFLERLARS